MSKARWFGAIGVEKDHQGGKVAPGEIKTLSAVGVQAGVALQNAFTYHEEKNMAQRDSLTLLFNHAYFRARLDEEIRGADRYGFEVCLLMMDIDNFKSLNDTFGHLEGDAILKELAIAMINNLRDSDTAARYGGDEFAVILTRTNKERSKEIAERLRASISENKFIVDNKEHHITISIGAAIYPNPQISSAAELIKMADDCLYLAKNEGRNLVRFCE